MYNFAEQLNWAAKIGLIRDARRRRKIERWTSVAELATYVFTINVSMLTLWRCAQRETRARREYHSRGLRKKDDDADDAAASRRRCDSSEGWVWARTRLGDVHGQRRVRERRRIRVRRNDTHGAGPGPCARNHREERTSAVLALVSDSADVAVSIGDVRGVRALTAPGTVNAMGLVSASCGVVDKWRATKV